MVIPGINEQNFDEVKNKVKLVESVASSIHVDIADGVLVNGRTFTDNINNLDALASPASFELHIMATNPIKYVSTKLSSVVRVCAQIEAESYMADFITVSNEQGYAVGLSISPQTPLEKLLPYLPNINYVQFMTVTPGGSGRPFNYGVLETIKKFKADYPFINVQVDGGIDQKTMVDVVKAGVEYEVVTSHLFISQNIREVTEAFINLSKVEHDARTSS